MNEPSIPRAGNLVWRREWEAPGESPFSIAAKAIQVNSTKFFNVISFAFNQRASLNSLGPSSLREILCSKRFRYCPICLGAGYHGSIYQLWKVERCPIHDIPLISTCNFCNAPTCIIPLIAPISPKFSFDNFFCARCHRRYGPNRPNYFSGCSKELDFHPIEDLLKAYGWLQAEPLSRVEINASNWAPINFSEDEHDLDDKYRGILFFNILEHQSKHRYLRAPIGISVVEPFSPVMMSKQHSSLSVPHLLLRSLGPQSDRESVIPSFGVKVPLTLSTPPVIHALWIWQAQMTSHSRKVAYPTVGRSKAQEWDLSVQEANWHASMKIANLWRRELEKMQFDKSSREVAALRTTTSSWSKRLGRWDERNYSPVLVWKQLGALRASVQRTLFVIA